MHFITNKPICFNYTGPASDEVCALLQDEARIGLSTFSLCALRETLDRVLEQYFPKENFVSTPTHSNRWEVWFDMSPTTHRSVTYLPKIEVEHDSKWDNIGRAFYDSRDYQFTEFHCTLCSMDELNRQIEAKMRELGQNRIVCPLFCIEATPFPTMFDRYLSQRHWNEDFYAWIEDYNAHNHLFRTYWEVDGHSYHPYDDKSLYLHQLAKLSLSGTHPQTRVAARPRCRSYLMASCHQSSGDDLLGH